MSFQLLPHNSDDEPIVLKPGVNRFGRGKPASITSKKISRDQIEVELKDGKLTIKHLGVNPSMVARAGAADPEVLSAEGTDFHPGDVVFLIPDGPAFVLLEADETPGQKRQASEELSKEKESGPKRSRSDISSSAAASDAVAVRYEAGMVLAAAGDALGYKNGHWEFLKDGATIHAQMIALGGLEKIRLCLPDWRVSDDTVLHLATAEALMEAHSSREKLYLDLVRRYVAAMKDMSGRAPGVMTIGSCSLLKPDISRWREVIQFNPKAGGCGSAIRTMCIGMRYVGAGQRDDLIAVAVESGRMTHNHPVAILGGVASALFAAYAIEGLPLVQWGREMLATVPRVLTYLKDQKRDAAAHVEGAKYFEQAWKNFLRLRGIDAAAADTIPRFPSPYGVLERDAYYKEVSFDGWGGSSGHDAPLIAYEALLAAPSDWNELMLRAALHAGDSDSTATIAGALYGLMHGYRGVPPQHHKYLEYHSRLVQAGRLLHLLAHP